MAIISNGKESREFNIRDLPSIWDLTIKQTWLVEGLIPENAVVMLSGESGGGKSTIALLLADAVSRGEPFLDMPTVKRSVLIADRENSLSVYHERFERFDLAKNPDLLFWGYWNDPEPMGPNTQAIEEFVIKEHPLLIFDSFIAFNDDGDEQDATATREYMDHYRKLTGLGATVVLIHHTGKGENTKEYRGSSDIKASLDVGLVLVAKKPQLKLLTIRPFKVREGGVEPISAALEGNKLVRVDTEYVPVTDPDWELVRKTIEKLPGANQGQIIKDLPDMTVSKIRKILLAGTSTGVFRVEKGLNNASFYFLGEHQNAQ